MPFDGTKISTPAETDLVRAANNLGITPIPHAFFTEYKRKELAKHPGSWLYRYQHLVEKTYLAMLTLSFVCAVFSPIFSNIIGKPTIAIVIGGMGSFLMLFWLGASGRITDFEIKTPAEWYIFDYDRHPVFVPPAILKMARKLQAAVPYSHIIIGELRQNTVLLDPYLIVQTLDDEIVIGIWDNTGILYIAEQH